MKSVVWFILGAAGGFVAAHLVNKDPRGRELLADVDARITEFTERIQDAYHAQEAKIEGLVESAKEGAAHVAEAATDAAEAASDAAGDKTAAKNAD